MSNSIIRSILETQLKTWADVQVPIIPIAFEGNSFIKPLTGGFLEPSLIPNVTLNKDISGKRKSYYGIFEVKCWYPRGTGMGAAEKLSSSIIELFPLLPKSSIVSIESTPHAEYPQYDDSGWIILPVLVMYRYENLN